jgi:acyl transferase domain-containing protein
LSAGKATATNGSHHIGSSRSRATAAATLGDADPTVTNQTASATGAATAVERAMHKCRDAGARRAMVLPVSVPSHCELMKGAAEGLDQALAAIEIRSPEIPVLHNVDVAERSRPEDIRSALVAQLYSPVRWTATAQAIAAREVLDMTRRMAEIIARHTGKPADQVMKDIDRDRFMTAEEAVEYGLIDEIVEPRALADSRLAATG